ncbi:MAG: UvrD-helicase domain-containing protein [Clostridia bacterium]|nr:UvrD-helicase domain-containing protein [Clostridia bacterium]
MNEIQIKRFLKAKRALFDKHYSFLNDKQREAVYTVNGPVLILAGAGSGKTTVLVNRIAHIIKYGNAYYSNTVPEFITEDEISDIENAVDQTPAVIEQYLSLFAENACPTWNILAITFTNKAANEIKARLEKILKEDASDIWAGTFHSICMRILRRHGELVGYRPAFSVCDTDDAKKVITLCMKDLNITDKILTAKEIMNVISKAKDKLQTPDDFEEEANGDFKYKQIAKVYRLYQKRLMESNVLDFDDIIMKTVELFRANPDVLVSYQNKFKYVCIDEYQDTNYAQFVLVSLISEFYKNIMVVGDDDQSIYKFRGATIENILNFDSKYDKASVIKLEQNYRSTSNILNAANDLISKNPHKYNKTLWSDNDKGCKITVKETQTQNDESRYIIERIMKLKAENSFDYKNFAVLYRMKAQSQSLETVFAKSGIPYRMFGALRFYDREEIKDIIAYLSVINNNSDNIHLRRIIGKPKRKIGDTSFNAAAAIAEETGVSIIDVMLRADTYNAIPKSAANSMVSFAMMIKSFSQDAKDILPSELTKKVIKETGYENMLILQGETEKERLENLDALITAVKEYEDENEEASLTGFLEQVALVSDIDKYDENADAVTLMTVHSAKGLEFPVVFLPGMEDGVFPSQQSMFIQSEIEEERRLAYVAITRAKKILIVIHARERMMHGMTQRNPLSRFIKEIDEEYLDIQREMQEYARPAARSFEAPKSTYSFTDAFKKPERKPIEPYNIGDRVNHASFGDGTVIGVTKMSSDYMYEIMFDTVGTKRLMATYTQRLMKKI